MCKGGVLCKPAQALNPPGISPRAGREDNMRLRTFRSQDFHRPQAVAAVGIATVLVIVAVCVVAILEMLPR
jgi:hypothetical protein